MRRLERRDAAARDAGARSVKGLRIGWTHSLRSHGDPDIEAALDLYDTLGRGIESARTEQRSLMGVLREYEQMVTLIDRVNGVAR